MDIPQAQIETHQEDKRPPRLLILRQLGIVEEVADHEASEDITKGGDESGERAGADIEVLGFESSCRTKPRTGEDLVGASRRDGARTEDRTKRTNVRPVEPGSEEERE